MDVNSSDQNGKPSINISAEDPRDPKEKNELPAILRPKFTRNRQKKRRQKHKSSASKETTSKDDDVATVDKHDVTVDNTKHTEDRDDEKPSLDKASLEKASKETQDTEDGGHTREKDIREKDTREKEPRERETEEPECRESEIRILPIEVPSDTDLRKPTTPIVIQDDKSDEKKKKKEKLDSLDEGEKKRSRETGSKRKKLKEKRKKTSGRNSGRNNKQQLSGERRRRKTNKLSKETPNPSPRNSIALKTNNSAENIANKKSKMTNKISDSASKNQEAKKSTAPTPPPKKKSFFKSIFDKTKFWMRKSDDVAQPTKEMLFKQFVSPEYDMNNPADFVPDPKRLFSTHDWELRLKNSRCEPDVVFVNNRPFWIHRTNEDVIPKVKLMAFHVLMLQQATFNLNKLPKRTSFHDPLKTPLNQLTFIDKTIGVDNTDPNKVKELFIVTQNTFNTTLQMQAYRQGPGKKKVEDDEAKLAKETAAAATTDENKKSGYGAPKVTFDLSFGVPSTVIQPAKDPLADKSQRPAPQVVVYNRKERPPVGSIRVFASRDIIFHTKIQVTASASFSSDALIAPGVKSKN